MNEIVIKISDELLSFVYRNGFVPSEKRDELNYAILECVELPKGHGRLIDADDVNNHIIGFVNLNSCPTIIEADKEYEVEVVTRGNCMMCGKELTEGLFFCKECENKARLIREAER